MTTHFNPLTCGFWATHEPPAHVSKDKTRTPRWTPDELDLLNFLQAELRLSNTVISKLLGRTRDAVRHKRCRHERP